MGIVDPRQSELDVELEDLDTGKPEVPEKLKGKSVEDVYKMYEEAEKKASRIANELGQLRQTTLQPRQTEIKEPVKKEVKVDDLLEDPEDAVNTLVNQNPVVKRITSTVDELEQNLHRQSFESEYPAFREDIKDDKFMEWVSGNPVRRSLATAADKLDYQAASALWNMWEERKAILQEAEASKSKEKEQARKAALKKGTLESGTGQPTETKKVMSRAEIIGLKERALLGDRKAQAIVSNPEWQASVMQAYAEGRAK